jgi:hypothetical protein
VSEGNYPDGTDMSHPTLQGDRWDEYFNEFCDWLDFYKVDVKPCEDATQEMMARGFTPQATALQLKEELDEV